mmetsp:Transcript_108430/g.188197  ORF Transcript_108430/g.188197 Transcript_108430/m.188197 type:complete len:232 (+) Transcript_108430:180-875(+)
MGRLECILCRTCSPWKPRKRLRIRSCRNIRRILRSSLHTNCSSLTSLDCLLNQFYPCNCFFQLFLRTEQSQLDLLCFGFVSSLFPGICLQLGLSLLAELHCCLALLDCRFPVFLKHQEVCDAHVHVRQGHKISRRFTALFQAPPGHLETLPRHCYLFVIYWIAFLLLGQHLSSILTLRGSCLLRALWLLRLGVLTKFFQGTKIFIRLFNLWQGRCYLLLLYLKQQVSILKP